MSESPADEPLDEKREEKREEKRTIWSRYFRGRRPAPLIGPWVSSIFFAAVLFYFQRKLPALDEVVDLIYWVLILIVFVTTARWLRARTEDRRRGERRRVDQREGDRNSN